MDAMKLKEQQRINMKAIMERETAERTEQQKRFASLHPIYERSHESSSQHDSLLMQSLQVDNGSHVQREYNMLMNKNQENKFSDNSSTRSTKSYDRREKKSSSKKTKRKKEGPTHSFESSSSMSFDISIGNSAQKPSCTGQQHLLSVIRDLDSSSCSSKSSEQTHQVLASGSGGCDEDGMDRLLMGSQLKYVSPKVYE